MTRLAVLATAFALGISSAASAAPITVNKTDDHNDGNCTASDCTLREAVAHAQTDDVVVLHAGTYTLSATELGVSGNFSRKGRQNIARSRQPCRRSSCPAHG